MGGSNRTEIAAGIDISANVKDALTQIDKVNKSLEETNKQLVDVLKHFDDLNKKTLGNINKQINKNIQNRNISQQNIAENYDFGTNRKVAKNSLGSVIASDTGREKIFQEYEQAIIAETKAIEADIKERTKLRKQRADAEDVRNQNTRDAIAKREDKTSASYLEDRRTRAQAELLRAKNGQVGQLLNNPRYQFGKAFDKMGQRMGTIGVGSDKLEGKAIGGVLSSLGALLKSPIAGGAAALTSFANGIVEVGRAATQAYAEIESIKTQLGVVFSNQTQADAMFGDISKYAVKSPFGVQQTSELAVLLKQSGVYASDLMDTLKMIGDTAGGNMEKMKRIANNYAQIVSIGKASMLDMRQFAYAGIPIFEAVSKELGVSQQELRKLISDGKVTSDIIEKVFKDLTGINGIFENATEKGAKTLKARLQNLQDAKQLALSEAGERIVNAGTKTGGDSYANNVVSWLENLYSGLEEWLDRGNIAKDVQTIARRNDRIAELEKLIEQNKDNKELKKILENELKYEKAKRDVDVERNTYAQSYDAKTERLERALEALEGFAIDNAELRQNVLSYLDFATDAQNAGSKFRGASTALREVGMTKAGMMAYKVGDTLSSAGDFLYNRYPVGDDYYGFSEEQIDELNESFKELIAAINQYNKITEEDIKANRERNIQNAQQSAYDLMNRQSDASGSLLTKFRELSSIYRDSDEYKEQEEKKRTETLKQALEVLQEIKKNTDDEGRVDITKFSANQLSDYIKQGAFTASEKLNVVTGNSTIDHQNREDLMKQYGYITGLTGNFLKMALPDARYEEKTSKFNDSVLAELRTLTDSEFYEQFPRTYEQQTKALDELIKTLPASDGRKNVLQMYRDLIDYSLNKIETDTTGASADLTKDLKGKELPDYIPLWKRVIANNTGWSAERITTSKDFMDEYKKYSAMQISRGGIQGLVQAGASAGEVGTLLSYAANKNKQGVHQVDWEKTEQNLYKYAINLETPLKRASATMKGLADAMQNQVDTYKKLTVDLYAAGEDWTTINNDIKGQYKTAQGLGNADVLDNAFEAFAKESDKFKVTFDDEKGLVVFDKLSNTIVGSVAELKEDSEIKDENLKKYLDNIKVDNLINALDKASAEILRNSNITQVQATMLEEAIRLEQKRIDDIINTYGQSGYVLSEIYKARDNGTFRDETIGRGITSRNDGTADYEAGLLVNEVFTNILKKISEMDLRTQSEVEKAGGIWEDKNGEGVKKNQETALKDAGFIGKELTKIEALQNVQEALNDPTQFSNAIAMFIEQFPEACERIIKEANRTADALDSDKYVSLADKYLRNSPEGIYGALLTNRDKTGNTFEGQSYMDFLGASNMKWNTFSNELTTQVRANRQDNDYMLGMYDKQALKNLSGMDIAKEDIEQLKQDLEGLSNSEAFDKLEAFYSKRGLASAFEEATDSGNKLAVSLGKIGKSIDDIADNTKNMVDSFAADALTSSMQTWGEALAKGGDASEEMTKNMQQLTAGLLQNMGSMLTQAGLSLAISSTGDKAGVLAGLAIAAAGGGLSFLGGYLGGLGEEDKNKEDSELQKLLKLKQDLSDLLKQAREDAIYYENTVRHKSALSANSEFTTKSVHDAIITPRGDVVTTDPKDYLIATKTPKSLVGGGAPTINFSVVDKSTGIKVTQQKSTYNADTNSIDFEAIIESKVQEVIATTKGDDAFAARESRLRGHTVIA